MLELFFNFLIDLDIESGTVTELSNNGQSNENKHKRTSRAKRKSLQRQKQNKQEQQQQQSGKQKRSAAGSEQLPNSSNNKTRQSLVNRTTEKIEKDCGRLTSEEIRRGETT